MGSIADKPEMTPALIGKAKRMYDSRHLGLPADRSRPDESHRPGVDELLTRATASDAGFKRII